MQYPNDIPREWIVKNRGPRRILHRSYVCTVLNKFKMKLINIVKSLWQYVSHENLTRFSVLTVVVMQIQGF
jgi:hypothetical protein